jgi:hypothetical protein
MLPLTDDDIVAGHISDWVRHTTGAAGSAERNDAPA